MVEANKIHKTGYLEDHQGNSSSMRLMSVVALVASIAFGLITVLNQEANDNNGLYITTMFLIAAFAPKALQNLPRRDFPRLDHPRIALS